MLCKLKDCAKCNGDLVLDGDEWRCWQCGTYYYPHEPVKDLPLENQESTIVITDDCEVPTRLVRARKRRMTNINTLIKAKVRSEQRWWTKNQDIIDQLKQGHKVRDISELVGKGQRQVRGVQERLKDMALLS